MYLFFYIKLIHNDFEAGKSITGGIGRCGPWKSRLFGPNGTRFLIVISANKKVSISRAHPFQCPS
jgi:hypothetical protein